ncbi:phosphoribosyl 1,2-cyclic phosphodiesterase [Thioclava sp. SK-1]|nr:phosphoribosyl 1,2-cyclic phosphodiesterase [Thioclava sp. SK-1]
MTLRFTILGCGSSGGVPRIGGNWGACDPANPKNRRRRCAMLVQRFGAKGSTDILIDTGPDLREQLLSAEIGALDGVVYTHAHADHIHGIDDLRQVVFNMGRVLPVWADQDTQDRLLGSFGYAFVQPADSNYKPICTLNAIRDTAFTIHGAGGPIRFQPFRVVHGNIDALGFRIGDLAYLPDVSAIPAPAWPHLQNLDCWVLDALRYTPHPTHAHLQQSLDWIAQAGARSAVLTNMHIDLDHDRLAEETPDHIRPAYDGLRLEYSSYDCAD